MKVRSLASHFKNYLIPKWFSRSPFTSSLYYLIFSRQFRREQHAVLNGKVMHLKSLRLERSNIYTLIRNTHRLEKGLLMQPRRAVFAKDYIEETVEAFEKLWHPAKIEDDKQFKWFYDVMAEYFQVVTCDGQLESLKKRFENKVGTFASADGAEQIKAIPYKRIAGQKPDISYEDFYALTRYRRSVRWFSDRKPSRELLDKAILAAVQSPSACNRQPFEYRIIDDEDFLKRVAPLPGGIKGYVQGIKTFMVIIGNLDAYFDERDRHVIYIDASLANMALMFALETLGLSSCPINWPDIESLERKMEVELGLNKGQRPLMCLAVGYPDPEGLVAFSEKRALDVIRKYN